eukprot:3007219-Karenia_brevis.AAC.1
MAGSRVISSLSPNDTSSFGPVRPGVKGFSAVPSGLTAIMSCGSFVDVTGWVVGCSACGGE